MSYLGVISHSIGAGAYLVLGLLLLTAWRGRLQGGILVGVVLVSSVWCAAVAVHAAAGTPSTRLITVLELCRDVGWFMFGFKILRVATSTSPSSHWYLWIEWGAYTLCLATVVAISSGETTYPGGAGLPSSGYVVLGFLCVSIVGWVLVEQIYRNTRREHRWAVKFLCLGVGAAFAYDFVVYAGAVLVGRVEGDLWNARGIVQAMIVPLIAVSAARNPQWSLEVFVSRHIVFHTATIVGAGGYLVAMSAVGYYIREVGGSWGGIAQVVFLCAAVLLLFMLFFSVGLRARLKVFFSKHFFKNKYDYREEWLRFTRTLSSGENSTAVRENVIQAICTIVESPGGLLWMRRGSQWEVVAQWNANYTAESSFPAESSLGVFLGRSRWVIFLDDCRADAREYEGLVLPESFRDDPDAWVLVPLTLSDRLLGFVLLRRSHVHRNLNWEDSDLFKAVGQQSASYLALYDTTQALSESQQFEAFNRLSSYVVHDLKNVVAQLSLVGENSKKHIDNPEFVKDAMETVQNATAKMTRMLAQLRKDSMEETSSKLVNVHSLVAKVVLHRSADRPIPSVETCAQGLVVRTDPDRLSSVLEHLIQNAQEATADTGRVAIKTDRRDDTIFIEINDSGCGMDENFIRQRLYKPFDTTKGNAGMGIGVYEARDFVVSSGGELKVVSCPGKGTKFTVVLPSVFDGVEHDVAAIGVGSLT